MRPARKKSIDLWPIYTVMAYTVMACIAMAYIVMAHIVMGHIVMAHIGADPRPFGAAGQQGVVLTSARGRAARC